MRQSDNARALADKLGRCAGAKLARFARGCLALAGAGASAGARARRFRVKIVLRSAAIVLPTQLAIKLRARRLTVSPKLSLTSEQVNVTM